ncbi:MAG: type II toxin-antitoxin system RelE/ParE family toxin [Coriobacteriaceae bacterium]|nr:type II toxin-antitoxin system RelE/ParE family toxin [Coriobacteriaceae bacterium]
MTQELRVHSDARREFNDAIDYYERESPGLGLLFTDEVDAGFARIRKHPGAAPQVAKDVRKLVLAKFPYNLIYETREDSLRILAVAHQRKRPYYWRGRR